MASSSTDKAALQNLRIHPDVRTVFYNPGILVTQVQSEKLYKKWILKQLRKDLVTAIFTHKADIIELSELGEITIGLGGALSTWKKAIARRKKNTLILWKICF